MERGNQLMGIHTCLMNYFTDANLWENLNIEISVRIVRAKGRKKTLKTQGINKALVEL